MSAQPTTTWYHGTSTATGLERLDWMDPSRANFEPCVWATSSLSDAQGWAHAATIAHGGEAVVYILGIEDARLTEMSQDDIDDAGYDVDDVDAVIITRGEGGVPTLAILRGEAVYCRAVA